MSSISREIDVDADSKMARRAGSLSLDTLYLRAKAQLHSKYLMFSPGLRRSASGLSVNVICLCGSDPKGLTVSTDYRARVRGSPETRSTGGRHQQLVGMIHG